jgi:FkbM family methyltransferase
MRLFWRLALSEKLKVFAAAGRHVAQNLVFTVLDVGAVPQGTAPEKFMDLLAAFPGSRVHGFELDPELCAQLNHAAAEGLEYHARALSDGNQTRRVHLTASPLCASLYEPNHALLTAFRAADLVKPVGELHVETIRLDRFAAEHGIGPVDFIKVDVQGADLDVLKGAGDLLKAVSGVLCEVEFIELYFGQPLFGDVDRYLTDQGLRFHRFLKTFRLRMKGPEEFHGIFENPSQDAWSDALFLPRNSDLLNGPIDRLLKAGVIASTYDADDFALACMLQFDSRAGSDFARAFAAAVRAT